MSQLSDIREDLARWLQDSVNVQWSAAILNRYINLALRETEKHVLAIDPEAFKCTYTAATTVPSTGKDNIYSYPAGTFAVFEIALSSDGVSYVRLQRLSLKNIRDMRAGDTGSEAGFVPYTAKHFILWPSPETAVTSGLRTIVAPTLVMADDTDENPLPLSLEALMMKHAQKLCLYDVGEDVEKVQKEIDDFESKTPRFYLTATEPAFVEPNITRY
jgi:hypothetical protein